MHYKSRQFMVFGIHSIFYVTSIKVTYPGGLPL